MTDRALQRRVCAVEKRLGVTGRPLQQLSDLDLLGAIEAVAQHLAAAGNSDAKDTLAQYDAQEAALRAFWQRSDITGRNSPVLEPDVRWPYLRARARWHEATHGQDEPRSAASQAELWRKIVAFGCLEGERC